MLMQAAGGPADTQVLGLSEIRVALHLITTTMKRDFPVHCIGTSDTEKLREIVPLWELGYKNCGAARSAK